MENAKKIFIGKKCKITFKIQEEYLFYTGTILEYDNKFIIFIDKFHNLHTLESDKIKEIHSIKEGAENEN